MNSIIFLVLITCVEQYVLKCLPSTNILFYLNTNIDVTYIKTIKFKTIVCHNCVFNYTICFMYIIFIK